MLSHEILRVCNYVTFPPCLPLIRPLIIILTALRCLQMHCFVISVWLHSPVMCPVVSSMGQIVHVLCGIIIIMCSRALLPSLPVLHLSMLAFMLSVTFGTSQNASLCWLSLQGCMLFHAL